MKLRYRTLNIIIILALFSILLVGCGKLSKNLKFGFIGPLTGPAAAWGIAQKNGIEIAVEELNSAGGINGRKVEIIYEDSQMDSNKAILAMKKLTGVDKVPVVFGETASAQTLAIAPVANTAKVVLLSPISSSTAITGTGVFRISPADNFQASIAAKLAVNKGYKRGAIIYTNDEWGKGLTDGFKKNFTSLGGTIVSSDGTEGSTRDFRTQLTKVRESNVDFLYIPLHPDSAVPVLQQAKELGLTVPILGTDAFSEPTIVQIAKKAAEGIVYVVAKSPSGKSFEDFSKKYHDKFSEAANYNAAAGYDAVMVITEAIKKAKSIKGEDIKSALYTIKDYSGVSGVITFDANGDVTSKEFESMVIKDGKGVSYSGIPSSQKGSAK
ncbi:MAG: penicillin-binding protein activator [Candidatus Poribacteria bacterium]